MNASGLTCETFDGGTYVRVWAGPASGAPLITGLSHVAAAIDNVATRAMLSAFVGGFAAQGDNAQVTFEFFDAFGTSLRTVQFGPVFASDRGGVSRYVGFDDLAVLTPGVRSAVVTVTTVAVFGANDGTVDNVSMRLETPALALQPDSVQTPSGEAVTRTPLANDLAGGGASLEPGSLHLLSQGQEVLQLSTTEGSWHVDAQAATVTFTPAPGVSDITASTSYVVRDSSGQSAMSAVSIEVLAPVIPEEPIVIEPVPSPSDPKGLAPTPLTSQVSPPDQTLSRESVRSARVLLAEPEPELPDVEAVVLPSAITVPPDASRRVSVVKTLEVEDTNSVVAVGVPLSIVAVVVGVTAVLANRRLVLRSKNRS